MADRVFNHEDLVLNVVQNGLDRVDALQINHDHKSHPKTFLFALALGVGEEKRMPNSAAKRLAWVQYSAFNNADSEILSLIKSVALSELRKEMKDNLITDEDLTYEIAAEYVNSGLTKIKKMIPDFNNYDEFDFTLQLIDMMDEKIAQIRASEA